MTQRLSDDRAVATEEGVRDRRPSLERLASTQSHPQVEAALGHQLKLIVGVSLKCWAVS